MRASPKAANEPGDTRRRSFPSQPPPTLLLKVSRHWKTSRKTTKPMLLVEAGPISIPPGLVVVSEALAVQMVAERPHERIEDNRIQPLDQSDAEEMLALATLTKPGPFTFRAQSLGPFWGIKTEGRLIAMAGQRLRQTGFTELSGLCTHPEFQRRGLGTLLFRFVAGEIATQGETAYLHAYANNTPAIALYKSLGFRLGSEMNLRIVKRRA